MTQFQPSEIQEFLDATDSYLKSSFDLVIIGGAAAALAYKAVNLHLKVPQVIGNSNTIRMNFLLAISELFGDELADQAEELTKNWQS